MNAKCEVVIRLGLMEGRALIQRKYPSHGAKIVESDFIKSKSAAPTGSQATQVAPNRIEINLLPNKRVPAKDVDPLENQQTPKRKNVI